MSRVVKLERLGYCVGGGGALRVQDEDFRLPGTLGCLLCLCCLLHRETATSAKDTPNDSTQTTVSHVTISHILAADSAMLVMSGLPITVAGISEPACTVC